VLLCQKLVLVLDYIRRGPHDLKLPSKLRLLLGEVTNSFVLSLLLLLQLTLKFVKFFIVITDNVFFLLLQDPRRLFLNIFDVPQDFIVVGFHLLDLHNRPLLKLYLRPIPLLPNLLLILVNRFSILLLTPYITILHQLNTLL
jgi:hypothetical protein